MYLEKSAAGLASYPGLCFFFFLSADSRIELSWKMKEEEENEEKKIRKKKHYSVILLFVFHFLHYSSNYSLFPLLTTKKKVSLGTRLLLGNDESD